MYLLSNQLQITISKNVDFNILNDKIQLDFDINKKNISEGNVF